MDQDVSNPMLFQAQSSSGNGEEWNSGTQTVQYNAARADQFKSDRTSKKVTFFSC